MLKVFGRLARLPRAWWCPRPPWRRSLILFTMTRRHKAAAPPSSTGRHLHTPCDAPTPAPPSAQRLACGSQVSH
ncbi:hypothetical protein E2C01_049059 [Portunus trituberculatus]|uniref:Uncharacterized protein n=1 Tax=Portunus trituberculatus TaxID=210409 RepID=A0A5B7GCT5_PORTR|nr:hypothetical protein [Portunus trituberculatus]